MHCDDGGGGGNGGGGGGTSESLLTKTDSSGRCRSLLPCNKVLGENLSFTSSRFLSLSGPVSDGVISRQGKLSWFDG